MPPKEILRKIRTFWGPKMRGTVGSLYDIVEEEEQRLRELAKGKPDIEDVGTGNALYKRHTAVIETEQAFLLAAYDLIHLMKENQTGMYISMSTWVGRPQDPDIAAQIVHLKGLSFSDSLHNLRLVLNHLVKVNSEETRKLLSEQFASIYLDLEQLFRQMDILAGIMQTHLSEITPVMIQYSKKQLPRLTRRGTGSETAPPTYPLFAPTYGTNEKRRI